MKDSFWSSITWLTLIVTTIVIVVTLILTIIWSVSKNSIATDCEKLGGFYVNHKTYKCELVE
jgi:flagellar basal body-associated protein FliL